MQFQNFSLRQLLAISWWNQPQLKQYDGLICDGSVRSGKTMAMTLGFFLWSMATTRGKVYGICGKTIGALRRNSCGGASAFLWRKLGADAGAKADAARIFA